MNEEKGVLSSSDIIVLYQTQAINVVSNSKNKEAPASLFFSCPFDLLPMVAFLSDCPVLGGTGSSITLNIDVMENKKKGRPTKEKEKLSCSINLKLNQEDFNSVKVTMFVFLARRDGCSRPLPHGAPRAMSICVKRHKCNKLKINFMNSYS